MKIDRKSSRKIDLFSAIFIGVLVFIYVASKGNDFYIAAIITGVVVACFGLVVGVLNVIHRHKASCVMFWTAFLVLTFGIGLILAFIYLLPRLIVIGFQSEKNNKKCVIEKNHYRHIDFVNPYNNTGIDVQIAEDVLES